MQALRASQVHADDLLRIIAIEAVRCSPRRVAGLYQLDAAIQPVALIVCAAGGRRLVCLTGSNTSIEELERKVSGLSALLAEA